MKFIDLNKQYQQIKSEVDNRIQQVLDSGQYIMGKEIAELEEKLASFVGAKHCIGVANGTDALLIAMMALDIQPGDEIITPAFSYIAVVEMAVLYGIKPVLIDVDAQTYNTNPELIEQAITEKTKAIIPVSMYGQCCDYDAINAIAEKHNLIQKSDAGELEAVLDEILAANPQAVEDAKGDGKKKKKAFCFLLGQVMQTPQPNVHSPTRPETEYLADGRMQRLPRQWVLPR